MENSQEFIQIFGAKEHNLQNIDLRIPRNQMVVITGVSGSGKSSLAFDTIYAEGQRRYMETFSAYARQFIGDMERPDVEKITGLSPVIAIEQKTTSKNPRSTVGTVTEIYDFLRLLFARAGDAYSYNTGQKMVRYTEEEIANHIFENFEGKKGMILAPLVRARKGHYRELFDQMRKQGFSKMRIDGFIIDLSPGMQVDRYKVHDIELVVDRIVIEEDRKDRFGASLQTALRLGNGFMMFMDYETEEVFQYSKHLMCAETGLSYEEPSPNSFSFNSPYGACPNCKGLGVVHEVEYKRIIPDDSKTINQIGILPLGEVRNNMTFKQLRAIAKKYDFTFSTPISELTEEALHVILHGGDNTFEARKFGKEEFSHNLAKEGLIHMLKRYYKESTSEKIRRWAEEFMVVADCSECNGTRLKKQALFFKIAGKNIADLAQMDIQNLYNWVGEVVDELSGRQLAIAKDILKELRLRLGFLLDVGLDYLSLNRPARTLSGGESQRIRLATQIGSQLTGITYILDEPSIGLHQRDNEQLIKALRDLTDIGNTVLVVEHDKDIMMAADYLIDLGPLAGKLGGEVVAAGKPEEFLTKDSITATYLNNSQKIEVPQERRKGTGEHIVLKGATGNNLKSVDLKIPLGQFVCITGVSGSGKSTLINETLYPILRQHFYNSLKKPMPYKSIKGIEHVDKVIEIDQAPIGRTPRSNPATYIGVFDNIRKLFSSTPESKIRGYKPGRFSFNVKGGRCEVCGGSGRRVIEMQFLPNVEVECENCSGKRYNRETLEILYGGESINDILDMTVDEATTFFEKVPRIHQYISTLQMVGLGYITLGQSATTLSGGEAQRIKLAKELAKKDTGNTLYILDEPTTGLHFSDIKLLLGVLEELVDRGNTIVVIEHNMDVIKMADYIIDIGPEGGKRGGTVVVEGTPEVVAAHPTSHTGRFLKLEL
ncbi:excinuclease ABC subunit UvrA [Aureispira anguillae]|uniref:UvrABC system protein A n=1 Tax=Aureispira anguillae TaxID=2864201 RepID=A0A915YGM2_9BACT|nr:excinuclease ABC subunit UvrA [Aureispira anguillae]BDS12603.1 excinuclease ABC subunit UvrA [Aureispira anguillae]